MSALLGLDETTLVASKEIAIDRKFATKPAGKKVVKLTDTAQWPKSHNMRNGPRSAMTRNNRRRAQN